MMNISIRLLTADEFPRCGNIWDMERNRELAELFYTELISGNRVTFVCESDGAFIGEISLVYHNDDPDYTIPGKRAYVSRLLVKKSFRRQGIGTTLCVHLFQYAKALGYEELSIGVDLDNYAALKLYSDLGFDRILLVDADDQGKYVKLLKKL